MHDHEAEPPDDEPTGFIPLNKLCPQCNEKLVADMLVEQEVCQYCPYTGPLPIDVRINAMDRLEAPRLFD